EQLTIMSFLAGLSPQFETVKSQVLSSAEITSLHEVFTRVLRTENSAPATPYVQSQSALVIRNMRTGIGQSYHRKNHKNGDPSSQQNHNLDTGGIVCYYCHELGHTKRTCRKLHNKTQKSHSAHVVVTTAAPFPSFEPTVTISAD